ncbi:tRNA (Guanine37-N1) -methyltransferase [Thioalkalivibrio nitratireducens DSM 14787]|uniref:tRNA (guanine-N(1)-)-methyltransferase n=1 Tax=Thioalkalivibrio nitratireducens (strain DSM 14787 / UNIQEM 213 / ALEN2) TaxID=1255043 RepID=L0E177_THIND|nr:tRNA (guanosine(37)-N1)-methyltransferase TrmD [Thioalkalivibrio nitratireducens]AGA35058.1 tRNA (Guanine37-N1) -methyltransferase [Thioalkalivibrio nitratireducens DSM 14787]
MRFDVITLFPELVRPVAEYGVTGRAGEQGLFELHTWNPRRWGTGVHQAVDDRPYGGGPGMVMQYAPLAAALAAVREADPRLVRVIALTPQGRPLEQAMLRRLVQCPRVALLCGRYEGIDERLLEAEVDEEWSLGDYVLSGGELAAMVVIDGCARLLPGALGHADSADQDSFTGGLLDCPHYTRPEVIDGRTVPAELLTGHHARIEHWRRREALGRTWERRPDLLARCLPGAEDAALLDEYRGLRRRSGGRRDTDD